MRARNSPSGCGASCSCIHSPRTIPEAQARIAVFRRRLKDLGWTEGSNLRIDYHWAGGDADRMGTYAVEVVSQAPDVILGTTGPILWALRQATRTIPLVFVQIVDPVGQGFVESLARPGGNITGFTHFEPTMGGKWLEMLKEIAPKIALYNPESASRGAGSGIYLQSFETVASALGVIPTASPIRDDAEIERTIVTFAREPTAACSCHRTSSTLFIATGSSLSRRSTVHP